MTNREDSEITLQIQRNIRRINHGTPITVAIVVVDDVPITPRSIRRFMLMQEDYIQLEFSLATAEHIAIGDYVDEPLFGMRFYLTEEAMPKYNTNTGGYDYSLRFEAPYMVWKNWVHCLIADGKRMESQWHLTDRLETHAQQIADEVNLLTGENYRIDVTCDNAGEIHFLTYDGKNIIDSMNMIADTWECEWWVTNDGSIIEGVDYTGTIHFGKMETGASYEFRLGENVESMDITRDQQTYATRIYAYGGTQNIPESYDRLLILTATDSSVNAVQGSTTFVDPMRKLTAPMLKGTATYGTTSFSLSLQGQVSSSTVLSATKLMYADDYTLAAGNAIVLRWGYGQSNRPSGAKTVSVRVFFNGTEVAYSTVLTENEMAAVDTNGHSDWRYTLDPEVWINMRGAFSLSMQANVELRLEYTLTGFTAGQYANVSFPFTGGHSELTVTGGEKTASKEITVSYNGTTYSAVLNPLHHYGDETASRIRINSALSGFADGSKVLIPESSLNVLDVPYSFYSLDYTLGTLGLLGERRLHLPLDPYENRFLPIEPPFDMSQAVEAVVIFDKIFPKMSLVISEVTTENKIEVITHDDDSVERQNWTQYKFKVTDENGDPFTFNTRYIMDGNKLEAAFTAATSMASSGFMLGGMTFEVGFDNATQVFTVIRNEDYGAKLPNGWIYPQVGDTLFLTGWNPKAIESMSLVSDAELELAGKANDYLDAILAGQFTFTCRMMSGWLFDLEAIPFRTYIFGEGGHEPFHVVENEPFMVSNGYTSYRLPIAGDKVRVWHDALNVAETVSGQELRYKDSRIIGYELKLDKPYDTPTYIVGETAAYSRLRQLEKEITKL